MVSFGFFLAFLHQKRKLASRPVILVNRLVLPLPANYSTHVSNAGPGTTSIQEVPLDM